MILADNVLLTWIEMSNDCESHSSANTGAIWLCAVARNQDQTDSHKKGRLWCCMIRVSISSWSELTCDASHVLCT